MRAVAVGFLVLISQHFRASAAPAAPQISTRDGSEIIVSWAPDEGDLESARTLGTGTRWELVGEATETVNGRRILRLTPQPDGQFFRLRSEGSPILTLQPTGTSSLLVSWNDTGIPFALEYTDQLQPEAWRPVEQQPVLAHRRYVLTITTPPSVRFFRLRQQSLPVSIAVRLATDTGISATDSITSLASVTGTVSPRGQVASLQAGFDGAALAQYRNVTDALDAAGSLTLDPLRLDEINAAELTDGLHTLHLQALDAAATVVGSAVLSFTLDTTAPRVALSPADGLVDVLPGQLLVAAFDEPVTHSGPETIFPPGTILVRTLGTEISGRLVADTTGSRVSFVPATDLPGNALIEVAFAATNLMDRAGNVAPVLTARATFRTANNQGIPGSSLTGWVFNSVRNDQGGESPIGGAQVKVLNGEGIQAVTDVNGKFTLQNIPGGKLLVEVDGHTVRTPPGTFFPTVAKLFESIPGANTIIHEPIYLPLVQDAAFVRLSTTSNTTVANTAQLPGWSLEVSPNSVQRRDGTLASRVSISPVASDRLPAPLPPGVNPSLVITIQTEGGADVFTQPVPLTAPNLEGLPPGAKTVLWDFDHARGEFVPVATLTVSADGTTVTTDPGQGVLRPGWHFILDLIQGIVTASGANAYNKPNLDWDKVSTCTIKLTLSTTTLVTDVTQFAPGPLGLASGILNDVADGTRKSIDKPETQAKNVQDSITQATVEGLDQMGGSLSEAADQLENAATPVRNGQAAERLAEINQKAAQLAGKTGYILKSVGGIFNAAKLITDGPKQIDRWKEDVECLRGVLKDPPGDAIDRTLRALETAQEAVEAIDLKGFDGAAADMLEAGAALTRIYADVVELPGTRLIVEPQKAQLLAWATEARDKYHRASGILQAVQVQVDTARDALKAMQSVVAGNFSGRLYGQFSAEGREAATITGLGHLQISEPSGTSGVLTVADPVANLIGTATLSFPGSVAGQPMQTLIHFPPVLLVPSRAADANANGLPDDLDAVLGNPSRAQVAALRSGLPPDEAGLSTLGIIGRLSQRTEWSPGVFLANAYADLIAGDRVLYGLGGSNLLEVIDISRPSAPVKVGALRTTSFFSAARGYARGHRVAATGFGAAVFNVADPRNPRLEREIDYTLAGTDDVNPVLGANHLVVAKGKELLSFDIDTGRQVSSLSLAAMGNPIKMELNGDLIAVLTFEDLPNLQFTVTTVRFNADGKLTHLGVVRPFFWSVRFGLASPYGMAIDDRAAFVGPWLISAEPFVPGFGTIDLSDPANPVVIATPSTNIVTGAAMLATDNAGHLLATVAETAQNKMLEVYDVRDLTKTDRRILTLPLDSAPYAPRFTAGLAVFNTEGDTYVARVAPIDSGSTPPTIHEVVLETGATAIEDRHVGVHVRVTDDAQVARVELFIQGDNLVATDATYPFDLDFLPPTSLPDGQALTLTVRATDTGGNRSERILQLTSRARAPHVAGVTPPPGFTTKLPLTNASIRFDKPLVRAATAADFDLRAAGTDGRFDTADDVRVAVISARFNAENTGIRLDFGLPLPVGHYRLTAPAAKLTDQGGNALDGDFSGSFPSGNGSFGGDFVTTFDVLNIPEFALDALPFRAFPTDVRDYSHFDLRSGASPLVMADVNDDGRADIVRSVFAAHGDTNEYHVLTVTLQSAEGGFDEPLIVPAPNRVVQVLAGDVDGDGRTDLVTVSFDEASVGYPPQPQPFGIAVLRGNGDGTFLPATPVDVGQRGLRETGRFLLGQITGSGRMDLAQLIPDLAERDFSTGTITNSTPAEVLVYAGKPDGTLASPVSTLLPAPARPAFRVFFDLGAADFNHDGKADLLLPGYIGLVPTQRLISRGDGRFDLQADTVINDASGPLLADFNGDGETDVVAGNQFYRGLPGGGFERVSNEGLAAAGVQNFAGGIVAADFTGDGRTDLAAPIRATSFSTTTLGIFTLKPDGTFGLLTTALIPRLEGATSPAAADVNGDGRMDLVIQGGDGTDLPFFAYTLIRNADGTFPVLGTVDGLEKVAQNHELNGLPLFADLNGDGVPDVAGNNSSPNPERSVVVLPSLAGGFGAPMTNGLGVNDANFFIRVMGTADFNGDGRVDVVVSQVGFRSEFATGPIIYLMRGQGDGTLQNGEEVPGAKSLLATGDFNGDGKPDLLTAGFGNVVTLLPGQGDGTFGDPILSPDSSFSFSGPLLVGDFNGDGRPDLIARGGRGVPALGIWLNDSQGHFSFTSSTTGSPTGWELQGLGDFNRDGRLDALVNDRTGSIDSYQAIVLPGDGLGHLGAPLSPTPFPGAYNSYVQVTDINRDGALDLVAAGRSPNQLQEARISLGNGDGTFQPPISVFAPGGSYGVRADDFNKDGRIDLLIGQSLLLQRPPTAP